MSLPSSLVAAVRADVARCHARWARGEDGDSYLDESWAERVEYLAAWESSDWLTSEYLYDMLLDGRSPRSRIVAAMVAEWFRYARTFAVWPAPRAEDALSFDECERAGVDGTLRGM